MGVSMVIEPTTAPPRTGRMGVSAASLVFEAWGWLFREQPIEDYGIDAHVEPLDGPEQPARQLLALQIKTGASFFAEETQDGWWFRDTRRHWHYWLGHVLPVVIILYNPQTGKLFWQHADASLVQLTGEEGKLLIPRSQVLDSSGAGRDRLRQIVGEFRRADPLADSLPLLPPSAAAKRRGVLRATTARPENTMMVAWQLANGRHQPDLTADSLLKGRPSWLSDGGGQFEAAIGAYANDHGHREIARRAFELAAAYDRPDRDRLLSIAALLAVAQDDAEGAEADLAQVTSAGGLFPRLARAAITDRARPPAAAEESEVNRVVREADPAELAGEPTLLNVLASLAVRRGDLDEAIRQFELAAVADPAYPAGRLQLARALLARAAAGTAVLAHQDLGRARALAFQCLEDMRRWAGPSERRGGDLAADRDSTGRIRRGTPARQPARRRRNGDRTRSRRQQRDGPRRGGGRRDGQPRPCSQLRRAGRRPGRSGFHRGARHCPQPGTRRPRGRLAHCPRSRQHSRANPPCPVPAGGSRPADRRRYRRRRRPGISLGGGHRSADSPQRRSQRAG